LSLCILFLLNFLILTFQEFLETINPFHGKTDKEITDYKWARSVDIEPRNPDPAQKKRMAVRVKNILVIYDLPLRFYLFSLGSQNALERLEFAVSWH